MVLILFSQVLLLTRVDAALVARLVAIMRPMVAVLVVADCLHH